jgi:hypothetical protein
MPVPFPVDSAPVPELGVPAIAATSGADGEELQATTQAPSSRPGNVEFAGIGSHLRGLMRQASIDILVIFASAEKRGNP